MSLSHMFSDAPIRSAVLIAFVAILPTLALGQDGEDRVDVGGYGSFRLDVDDIDGTSASFTLRRFVLTTDARIGGRFTVYSEVEYERLTVIEVERSATRTDGGLEFEQEVEGTNGSEIALEQAWGEYRLSDALGVRFGAVLPPVGRFNLQHDDNLWNLPRRPLIDRSAAVLPASAAWTEMGLGFVGASYVGDRGRISYQAFLLTGTSLDFAIEEKVQTRDPSRNKLELEVAVSPAQGAFDGSNKADAIAGRFEYSPYLGSAFAVSGYAGRYTPEYLETNKPLTTIGFDIRQRIGSFDVESEFLYSRYAGVDQVLAEFAEAAVDQATETESTETAELENEIAIELGGLADARYGFWLDVSRPIALRQGTLGLSDPVLIPIIRYEHVWLSDDLDTFDFSGGAITKLAKTDVEQRRLSVGLAFRPVPQGVFHLVYSWDDSIEGSLVDPAGDGAETVSTFTFGLAVGF